MSGIFRDVTITWKGTEYTVTPTMRLLRSIEQGEISLLDISYRTSQGRPPASHIASVLASLLRSAGVVVTDDEVYREFLYADATTIRALTDATLAAFLPVQEPGKNPDAQAGN
jgi:hypothetical protein